MQVTRRWLNRTEVVDQNIIYPPHVEDGVDSVN